jgi:hypothetical protein
VKSAAAVLLVVGLLAGCSPDNGTEQSDDATASTVAVGPESTTAVSSGATAVGSSDTTVADVSIDDVRARATTDDGLLVPSGEQPEVLGPLGETELTLETDEGIVEIGTGSVPALVPDTFPIPDDFVVQLTTSTDAEAGFSGQTELTFDELVTLYRDGLAVAGYEVQQEQFIDGTLAVYAFKRAEVNGSVAISGAPGGGRSVLVTIAG